MGIRAAAGRSRLSSTTEAEVAGGPVCAGPWPPSSEACPARRGCTGVSGRGSLWQRSPGVQLWVRGPRAELELGEMRSGVSMSRGEPAGTVSAPRVVPAPAHLLAPWEGGDACVITTRLASCRGADCIFQKAPRWPGIVAHLPPAHTQHFPRSGPPWNVACGAGREIIFRGRNGVRSADVSLLRGAEWLLPAQRARISQASTECGIGRQMEAAAPAALSFLRPPVRALRPPPLPSLSWPSVFSGTAWRAGEACPFRVRQALGVTAGLTLLAWSRG